MLRNVLIFKKQCKISCPRSARKLSGLSRNARQSSLHIEHSDSQSVYFTPAFLSDRNEDAFVAKF